MRCSGPPGCGKTTLLNIISGLVIPSEGRLLFDDGDVTHLPTEQRNIAQVFQFPVIYDTMTVAENLAFPLKNRRLPKAVIERRVAEIARDARSHSPTSTGARAASRPTPSRRSRSGAASCAPTSRRCCSTNR